MYAKSCLFVLVAVRRATALRSNIGNRYAELRGKYSRKYGTGPQKDDAEDEKGFIDV
jgi:hypothetical protein